MYASGASSFHLWIIEEFNNLKKAKPDATVDYVVSYQCLLVALQSIVTSVRYSMTCSKSNPRESTRSKQPISAHYLSWTKIRTVNLVRTIL